MQTPTLLRSFAKRLPIIRGLVAERDQLRRACGFVPPGHFYSPLPCFEDVQRDEARLFAPPPRAIPGIEMHEAEQLALLEAFGPYYAAMPFQPRKVEPLRYYFENPWYSYSDAILLHCMVRHLKPRRIVEVGSGFSSCVLLDTREVFAADDFELTLIEPYPARLLSLVKPSDADSMKIVAEPLQAVDLEAFLELKANDILLVDSTHVSKIGSDVNRLFFEILPCLSPGVYIHFHDIFFPFEYPKSWVDSGRAWNEAYLLRSFLQYNSLFRVVLMNTFMERFHEPFFRERMPLCLKDLGGSIWIQKRA